MSSSGSDADEATRRDAKVAEECAPPIATGGVCLHGWSKCEFCGFDADAEGPKPSCAACGKGRPLQDGLCEPCRTRGFQPLAF